VRGVYEDVPSALIAPGEVKRLHSRGRRLLVADAAREPRRHGRQRHALLQRRARHARRVHDHHTSVYISRFKTTVIPPVLIRE